MRFIIAIVVLAVIVTLWVFFQIVTRSRDESLSVRKKPGAGKSAATHAELYTGLRDRVLRGTTASCGLAPSRGPTYPWGVLMDWTLANGTATVVALSDGSASVYLSGGGGYIGGHGQAPIRLAAERAVDIAQESKSHLKATDSYPLPERGQVFFYALTDSGVLAAKASEESLREDQHPLSKLGNAMQDVITQYRLWDEQQKRTEPT